ncbi:MAG: hypothetical protein ASARMPRED_000102 [Alectoria sarmentosa]|nr:MAG: hypothetical protein ASARMPRED_000102 [Alectoria sarmentosa]
MENEEVFEADVVHGLEQMHSHPPYRPTRKGHDTVKAPSADLESERDIHHEESPLLSPNRGDGGRETSEHGVGETRGPPKWNGEGDFEGRPWWNKPSVFWLLPPYFLFTLAYGGTLVPRINLILSLICEEYFSEKSLHDPSFQMMPIILGGENPQCRIPEIQSLVAKFTLYCNLVSGLLSAIVSPKLGALSDRYGRKWMISVTIIGSILCEIVIVVVARYPDIFSVNWILLGYAFDGLGGSFIAAMALSFAYASDCTAPDKRNVVFGYYHGCLFCGIAIGPILAGYIVKATGQLLSIFYIALGAHSAFLLFLLFVIPESLSQKRQLHAREKSEFVGAGEQQVLSEWLSYTIQPLTNMFKPLAILWPTGAGTNPAVRRNLAFLAAVDTTMFGVAMGSLAVVIIYIEYEFGWGILETSAFVSIVNICRVFTLLVILPVTSRILRGLQSNVEQRLSGCDSIDLGIIRTAIFFDLLGYIGYATVRTGSLFIICGAIASIGGMGSPSLQAALTKHVPPDRTGQVLGAMGLLHASARVVAPTIFNLIYAKTVGKFTQTVFVCLAATFGVAFILSWFIRPHVYWDQKEQSNDSISDGSVNEDIFQGDGDTVR